MRLAGAMASAVRALLLLHLALAANVSVIVDTAVRGKRHGILVGAGIEDVNNELYGGLYSQMVYGESFEEPASDGVSGSGFQWPLAGGFSRPTWKAWSETGRFHISHDSLHGNQSQSVSNGSIANFGLGQQGMAFLADHNYTGHLYVKARGRSLVTVELVSDGNSAREVLASNFFAVEASDDWVRLDLHLLPSATTWCGEVGPTRPSTPRAGLCGYFFSPIPEIPNDGTPGPWFRTCYQCSGGLVLKASGASVLFDMVFLQPGKWGLYKGLPARRDVAEQLFHVAGIQFLRLGGTMCNTAGYRWKRFRGTDRGAHGMWMTDAWHPYGSAGFRMFEVLSLCEAAGVPCAITVNNYEDPEDMADFVEYCFGDATTRWGMKRIKDGREKPYKPFTVEIGNEQGLNMELVAQVRAITRAMVERAHKLKLQDPLKFAVGQNIDHPNFNATKGGLNVTMHMLEVLAPLGPHAAWDAHIGGDQFKSVEYFQDLISQGYELFSKHANGTKWVVFEENGGTHNLQRALVRARLHIIGSKFGGFLLLDSAANGLQVYGQNDNLWDQGQVFMTPDKAWLSPFGWAQSMLSRHGKEFDIPVKVSGNHMSSGVDVGAYLASDGSMGLRIVNQNSTAVSCSVSAPWHSSDLPTLEIYELTSDNLTDVNPPSDPLRVSPRRVDRGKAELSSGDLLIELPLVPHSFLTVALRASAPKFV